MIGLIKRWWLPLISVIGTGIIGALCIALMTSGKVSFVTADSAANLAIFIAFQTLGVTIVKAGLDNYIFARATSDDSSALYNLSPNFRNFIIPAWLIFTVGSYFVLGTLVLCLIGSFSILCDAYAAIRTAEFTARNRFRSVALANLTKFPLYFLLLFIIGAFAEVGYYHLLYLFAFTSFVRILIVYALSSGSVFHTIPKYSFSLLSMQQILNYLLFRLDQVSIPFVTKSIPGLASGGLKNFVFLTKYPELVSIFAITLGSIVFPRLLCRWSQNSKGERKERIIGNICLFFMSLGGLFIYLIFFQVKVDIAIVLLPLSFAAFLSFEVNYATFKLLATSSFRLLLAGLVCAISAGFVLVISSKELQSIVLLYWIVPVQMTVFLIVLKLIRIRK